VTKRKLFEPSEGSKAGQFRKHFSTWLEILAVRRQITLGLFPTLRKFNAYFNLKLRLIGF